MNKLKEFFQNHKRKLFTSLGCFALVLMLTILIGQTATTTSENLQQQTVNTSSQSGIHFVMPIENGVVIKDFSNTTLKYNSTLKQWEAHKGVDIQGTDNADVRAVYDGEIVSVENNYLTGTVVTIKHTNSLQTVYGSLDENVLVKQGDKVVAGQVIGKVSTSAKAELADGPHLHFEVLENNVKVDPNLYLESANK